MSREIFGLGSGSGVAEIAQARLDALEERLLRSEWIVCAEALRILRGEPESSEQSPVKVVEELVHWPVVCVDGHRAILRAYGDNGWFRRDCDCGMPFRSAGMATTEEVEGEVGRPLPEIAEVEYVGRSRPRIEAQP